MTYSHLRADCLYTGITSGPNTRQQVWDTFTFIIILYKTYIVQDSFCFCFIQRKKAKVEAAKEDDGHDDSDDGDADDDNAESD